MKVTAIARIESVNVVGVEARLAKAREIAAPYDAHYSAAHGELSDVTDGQARSTAARKRADATHAVAVSDALASVDEDIGDEITIGLLAVAADHDRREEERLIVVVPLAGGAAPQVVFLKDGHYIRLDLAANDVNAAISQAIVVWAREHHGWELEGGRVFAPCFSIGDFQ